jgi:hypothetical protein
VSIQREIVDSYHGREHEAFDDLEGTVLAYEWAVYFGYILDDTHFSSRSLSDARTRSPVMGFVQSSGSLIQVLILSCLVRRFCLSAAASEGATRLVMTVVRRLVRSSRFNFLRSWSRAQLCLRFALMMTVFLWFVCRAPGRQFFEFWLFPSWFVVTLTGCDFWDPSLVIFWGATVLTWFLLGHYLWHLFDILSKGLGDEASRLSFLKSRWWNRKMF